jgi:Ca2+-binding RTX toxin-like protein
MCRKPVGLGAKRTRVDTRPTIASAARTLLGEDRLLRALTLTAVIFAALPGGALGATAFLTNENGTPCNTPADNCFVSYGADPGETNDIQATKVGDTVTIVDTGATITAESGCTSVSPQEVTCGSAAAAFFGLGDLDDAILISSGTNWIVRGDAGNDTITLCMTCRAFSLSGGLGDDTIRGGNGEDSLIGGAGNDTLVSGIGRDHLSPGEGNDAVAGGSGRDTVSYEGFTNHAVVADLRTGTVTGPGTDSLESIEDFVGTRFDDRITGNSGANVLAGLGGKDLLVGKAGVDLLVGGPHDDRLFGEAGPDKLLGEGGADLLVGGPDRDRLLAGPGPDTLLGRDSVRDLVRGQRGTDRARIDRGLDRALEIELFF